MTSSAAWFCGGFMFGVIMAVLTALILGAWQRPREDKCGSARGGSDERDN